MDNRNSGAAGGGIGLSGLTFLVFLVLKLCNVIDWSWWWVTAPLWIPIALFVGICGVVIVVAFFVGVIRYIIKSVRGRD
jgi:hypothetical protein